MYPSLLTSIYKIQALFQEETTQMHANTLKVSPYPPTLNSLKNSHRHTPQMNRQPVQHPGGRLMPQQPSKTVSTTLKNEMKKSVFFFFFFLSSFLYLLMHHATPPPSHPTHPMPFTLTPNHHPKARKHAPGKSLPLYLELTQKHPPTYSPAKWMTCAARERVMDATTVKNGTHCTQKQNEKKSKFYFTFFLYLLNALPHTSSRQLPLSLTHDNNNDPLAHFQPPCSITQHLRSLTPSPTMTTTTA
jgi:hypothetical protein